MEYLERVGDNYRKIFSDATRAALIILLLGNHRNTLLGFALIGECIFTSCHYVCHYVSQQNFVQNKTLVVFISTVKDTSRLLWLN